jgi:DNA-binding transcriptional LysR family regulator
LAQAYAGRFGLQLHQPPITLRSFPISAIWHRRNATDGAVTWFLQQLQIVTSPTID